MSSPRILQAVLFLNMLSHSLLTPIIPLLLYKGYIENALRLEIIEQAPVLSINLQSYGLFLQSFIRLISFPIVIKLSLKVQKTKILIFFTLLAALLSNVLLTITNISSVTLLLSSLFRGVSENLTVLLVLQVKDFGNTFLFEPLSPKDYFKSISMIITSSTIFGSILAVLLNEFANGYEILLPFATVLSVINVFLYLFVVKKDSSNSHNNRINVGGGGGDYTISKSNCIDYFKRNPIVSLLIFILNCSIQLQDGLWIVYCKYLLQVNFYFAAFGLALIGVGSFIAQEIFYIFILKWKYEKLITCFSLFSQGLIFLVFLNGNEPAIIDLFVLGISSLFFTWANLGLRWILFKTNDEEEISNKFKLEAYSTILLIFGKCFSPIIFSVWFRIGYSTIMNSSQQHGVFVIEGIILILVGFSSLSLLCTTQKNSMIVKYTSLSNQKDIVQKSDGKVSPITTTTTTTNSTCTTPPSPSSDSYLVGGVFIQTNRETISPTLSMVVEEESYKHSRNSSRRNSILSEASSFTTRQFGDTIVEWEYPENHDFLVCPSPEEETREEEEEDVEKSVTKEAVKESLTQFFIRRINSLHPFRKDSFFFNGFSRSTTTTTTTPRVVRRDSNSSLIRRDSNSSIIIRQDGSSSLIRRDSNSSLIRRDSGGGRMEQNNNNVEKVVRMRKWRSETSSPHQVLPLPFDQQQHSTKKPDLLQNSSNFRAISIPKSVVDDNDDDIDRSFSSSATTISSSSSMYETQKSQEIGKLRRWKSEDDKSKSSPIRPIPTFTRSPFSKFSNPLKVLQEEEDEDLISSPPVNRKNPFHQQRNALFDDEMTILNQSAFDELVVENSPKVKKDKEMR